MEGRRASTWKRPSYPVTGARLSPRFALAWRLVVISILWSLTRWLLLCIRWSPTGNTVPRHWVVTRGSRWLGRPPLCSRIATRRALILLVELTTLKLELASLATRKTIVRPATPELGLVLEGYMTTPTRVETRPRIIQITETSILRPWGIYWCNKYRNSQRKSRSQQHWLSKNNIKTWDNCGT